MKGVDSGGEGWILPSSDVSARIRKIYPGYNSWSKLRLLSFENNFSDVRRFMIQFLSNQFQWSFLSDFAKTTFLITFIKIQDLLSSNASAYLTWRLKNLATIFQILQENTSSCNIFFFETFQDHAGQLPPR